MTNGKPKKGDLQDWMSCAAPLPNEQSKEFQLACTNCVGMYGKINGREFKTKKETRISAFDLRLKNLPNTIRRFFDRRAIHLAAEILDSFEWKSNTSTSRLWLNLRLILRRKKRALRKQGRRVYDVDPRSYCSSH